MRLLLWTDFNHFRARGSDSQWANIPDGNNWKHPRNYKVPQRHQRAEEATRSEGTEVPRREGPFRGELGSVIAVSVGRAADFGRGAEAGKRRRARKGAPLQSLRYVGGSGAAQARHPDRVPFPD